MFDLKDAYNNITLKDILSNITEWQLWKQYCRHFEHLDRSFKSEFYNDNNPSCRIYSTGNHLRYKDFGTGENLSIIEYIQKKYNCTFTECLNIIANDFNLNNTSIKTNINIQPLLQYEETITNRPKAKIKIVSQAYNITDYNYWNQYHIPLDILDEYDVLSCKEVLLYKSDNVFKYTYSKSNPIYAYRFVGEDGDYSYKIYFPLEDKKRKWLFSGKSTDIEGFAQLPLNGNLVIITKSMKDCMCYRVLGYNAISLQGESNKLDKDFIYKLNKRFTNIVINYDNDETGIKNTLRLNEQYGFDYFYINDAKDLSDYIKEYGLDKAKQQIHEKTAKYFI